MSSSGKGTGQAPSAQVFVDGSSLGNPGPSGVGVLIQTALPEGEASQVTIAEPIGETTNNQAEYQALIRALEECQRLGLSHIRIHLDSELVARQMNGQYRIKDEKLLPLYIRARELLKCFSKAEISFISRDENKVANNLAQNAARMAQAGLSIAANGPGTIDCCSQRL